MNLRRKYIPVVFRARYLSRQVGKSTDAGPWLELPERLQHSRTGHDVVVSDMNLRDAGRTIWTYQRIWPGDYDYVP